MDKFDEYIKQFPETTQKILNELRSVIQSAAPSALEVISYGMPTYKLNGNLVHFAAYKNHIGFYPTPSGIIKFKDRLINYKTSKGAIQFPINDKIPYDLIKEIVEFRINEMS